MSKATILVVSLSVNHYCIPDFLTWIIYLLFSIRVLLYKNFSYIQLESSPVLCIDVLSMYLCTVNMSVCLAILHETGLSRKAKKKKKKNVFFFSEDWKKHILIN